MLRRLSIRGFKSIRQAGPVELAPLTVLYGPNASGKSNLIDAVQLLSRLASERTVADALSEPIRGRALEAFTMPEAGLPGLLAQPSSSLELEAEIEVNDQRFRYRVEIAIQPRSGFLNVQDEFLAQLTKTGELKGKPIIERSEKDDSSCLVLRNRKRGRPDELDVGLPYTLLSDERYSGDAYEPLVEARREFSSWRAYYLDPRISMRAPQPPKQITDIGPSGQTIAPFLHRLQMEHPKRFAAVRRTVRMVIPSVDDVDVDLDERRGELDIIVQIEGTRYSSRILSEGTLRVLALVSLAVNPWGSGLIAFEEPENGVHPQRIELIADLLLSLATRANQPRQVIVTTHSPVFCGAMIQRAREQDAKENAVALYNVRQSERSTRLERFDPKGPLFHNVDLGELAKGFIDPSESDVFSALMIRGYLDG